MGQNWAKQLVQLVRPGVIVAVLGLGITAASAGAQAHAAAAAAARTAIQPATARPSAVHYPRGTVLALHKRVVRVTIMNFAFQPARLVVSPGTRIVWTNKDSDPHTVTSAKNFWASDALDTDNQYARVFKKAGAFPYYCSIHPYMLGTVIVQK